MRNRDRAIERRNYVIDRLVENGWIKQADADKARKDQLIVTSRTNGAHIFAGEYFAEEVRRDIFERYGEKKLYEGGLSVRTSLDPKLQVMARKTMAAGLVNYDEATGLARRAAEARRFGRLGRQSSPTSNRCRISRRGGWRWCWKPAINRRGSGFSRAASSAAPSARNGRPASSRSTACAGPRRRRGRAAARRRAAVSQVLQPGDVIYADPLINKEGNAVEGQYRLRQLPEVSGAMVVMDPWTGRVLAMVGGFSFDQSQFNRAHPGLRGSRARRSSRSSIPPRSITATRRRRVVIDAPIEIDQGQGAGVWRPENYSTGKYYGPTDAAQRAAALAQHRDRAARAGHRHAPDRRIRKTLRRL